MGKLLFKARYLVMIVVLAVTLYITFTNYQNTKSILLSQYATEQDMVEKSILQALTSTDRAYRIAEDSLNKEMKEFSRILVDNYRKDPDLFSWDLDALRAEFAIGEIYVIDQSLKIVRTTLPEDLGLDFSPFKNFANLLRNRMQGDSFSADRLDIAMNSGEIKKYSYMPTPDHKYLLELSVDISKVLPGLGDMNIISTVDKLAEEYSYVDNIYIYKFGATGLDIKEIHDLGTDSDQIESEIKSVIREAILTGQAKTINGSRYIPYLNHNQQGELDWWNSYVIGLNYNQTGLNSALTKQKNLYLSQILAVLIVFTALVLVIEFLFRRSIHNAKKLSTVINATSEGYCLVGLDNRILEVNEAFCRMLGYTSSEIIGTDFNSLLGDGIDCSLRLSKLLRGEDPHCKCESALVKKDGSLLQVVLNFTVVRNDSDSPEYLFAFIYDITERKLVEEQMKHLAFHDHLTGLPNRKLFEHHLCAELAVAGKNSKEMAVMFIDLDNFKEVNDEHGHDIGDELIRKASEKLRGILRTNDHICRMGGDEFTLLITDLDGIEDAEYIANRILESFEEPIEINNQKIFIRLSIGISIYPMDGDSPEILLRRADNAMYEAKRVSKSSFHFYNSSRNLFQNPLL